MYLIRNRKRLHETEKYESVNIMLPSPSRTQSEIQPPNPPSDEFYEEDILVALGY